MHLLCSPFVLWHDNQCQADNFPSTQPLGWLWRGAVCLPLRHRRAGLGDTRRDSCRSSSLQISTFWHSPILHDSVSAVREKKEDSASLLSCCEAQNFTSTAPSSFSNCCSGAGGIGPSLLHGYKSNLGLHLLYQYSYFSAHNISWTRRGEIPRFLYTLCSAEGEQRAWRIWAIELHLRSYQRSRLAWRLLT